MNILVTGGAGYIGSHMVHALVHAGHHPVVLDSLVAGHREAVPSSVPFVQADIRDHAVMLSTLRTHAIDAVMHFAARASVAESVAKPRMYWHDNVVASAQMLDAVVEAGVRYVIFSSTAAVYGTPDRVPIEEHQYPRPHNAYGATKRAVEMLLADYARAGLLSYAALRYFNAAGANVEAGLGERHEPETHLIPLAIEAARGTIPQLEVYGDDWPTPDGTCVRDYIHVCDLADAHLAALTYLRNGGESGAFNLGTGRGCSVRELIAAVERVSGKTVPAVMRPRRPGDPPTLVASPAKAEAAWGWRAHRSTLDAILRDAWAWHERDRKTK